MLDFKGIADYWWGDLPEPQLSLEPIPLGVEFSNERIEFRNPFEEQPSGEQDRNRESEEIPEPERED